MITTALIVRAVSLVLLALGVALGVFRAAHPIQDTRETLYVFGTLVEIEILDTDKDTAQAALVDVGQMLQRLHRDWHAWRPGMLSDLNEAIALGETGAVNDQLATILRRGALFDCQSDGLFNPAIGTLVGLWGFHADSPPQGAPPADTAIQPLVAAQPRMADLEISDNRIGSANAAVQLDLGGFAKGAALDMARGALAAWGIRDAVLNAGGGVEVMGSHDSRPWRVAIRDPFAWGAVAAVSLKPGEVLHTSGNYERFFDHNGQRFSHILDPRTGYPVEGIVSVSVLDTDGARADAAATALSVAGPSEWPQIAADMGITSALMIADDGAMMATPAMIARLAPPAEDATLEVQPVALPAPRANDCAVP